MSRDWQKDMELVQNAKIMFPEREIIIEQPEGPKVLEADWTVLEYWLQQAKTLKEDNARWTCKHTAAEQKYQTQSNVIAELKREIESVESWKEIAAEQAKLFLEAEEREHKLKEAIEERLPEMHPVSRELMKRTLASLYPFIEGGTNLEKQI